MKLFGGLFVGLLLIAGYVFTRPEEQKVTDEAMMQGSENTVMEETKLGETVSPVAMMEKSTTIKLTAQNNSNEEGTATISDVDGKTKVVINLTGAPVSAPQPAHIHVGSCPTPGAVKYPLTSVVNGVSETMLEVPYAQLLTELPLAVNVHKSAAEAKIYVSCGDIKNESMMQKDTNTVMDDSGSTVMQKSAVTDQAMMSKGSYETYSPEKLARAETGDVVLFFRASWCPSCRALDADIRSNMGAIPESLVILEVDYDTATALKQKYGVTYQHTLVQVDRAGNQIAKWSGSPTLAALIAEVK